MSLPERRRLALRPDDAAALENFAGAGGGGRWFKRALAVAPDFLQAWINLGARASGAGERVLARRALKCALALSPAADAAWFNLGVASGNDGAVAYRRTLALDPEALDATANLGDVLRSGDPLTQAIQPYRRALALDPSAPALLKSLMFCLHYHPETESQALFRLYRRWAALQGPPDLSPHDVGAEEDRRLRVGYLSADLYDHPVGRNLVGLLEQHDRRLIEVHVYAEPVREDGLTQRLKANAAGWTSTAGSSDRQVAAKIRSDRIDILVVLAGHTPFNRVEVAAFKPAPVQLSMHDFTTSGLGQVDYFLSDPVLSPEAGAERFTEKVVRLPCFYLHMPLPEVPLPEVPLTTGGDGPLVFGSCSNPAKLNDRVIGLWARVLEGAPGTRLRLKYRERFADPLIQRRWRDLFARAGVDPERLDFVSGGLGLEEHLARVGELDIALDPFPFNGSTTTYEALWMGVPVVTLAGERFVGRTGLALLAQVGLAGLAVETEGAYVAAALGLARDAGRRARLRRELRDRLKASPLLDAAGHARHLEAALRRMWRDWCRRPSHTKERNHA
ncbi:MAG: hypothetical protein EPO00_10530 [Chloroflexota bacterium]|nr:MAG: hypothetical protein EPO00_10530 [Chloroflexota bacterium]